MAETNNSQDIQNIESLCKQYDEESVVLEEMIASLESDLAEVKQKHLAPLKQQARVVARREAALHSAIEAAPELFQRPRTATLHGIKVGFTLSAGRLVFDDADTVVKLIKKHFSEDVDIYVRKYEEPNKDLLKSLSIEDLTRLGCRIEGVGDVVVLKRVAGDVEKLINKLIDRLVEAMVTAESD